jgi:hypothetical protein
MAQVPPPPQAEGRKIFWVDNVLSKLLPGDAFTGFSSSPLMMIFTSPDGTSFALAYSSKPLSNRITRMKATVAKRTTDTFTARIIMLVMF